MASTTSSAVLDEAFRIYRLTVWRLLPLSVLLVLAAQAPNIYRLGHAGRDGPWWLLAALGSALSLLFWAALVLRMAAMARGASLPLSVALARAVGLLPHLLLLAALSLAGIAAGLVLLVLPGLYALLVAVFAPLVLLFEGGPPLAAARAALALLRGRLGLVAAVLAMALAVFLVFYIVCAVIGVLVTQGLAGAATAAREGVSYAGLFAQALFAPLLIAATLALYQALRAISLPHPAVPPETPAAADR